MSWSMARWVSPRDLCELCAQWMTLMRKVEARISSGGRGRDWDRILRREQLRTRSKEARKDSLLPVALRMDWRKGPTGSKTRTTARWSGLNWAWPLVKASSWAETKALVLWVNLSGFMFVEPFFE